MIFRMRSLFPGIVPLLVAGFEETMRRSCQDRAEDRDTAKSPRRVAGIKSESWPALDRNGGRNQSGAVAAFTSESAIGRTTERVTGAEAPGEESLASTTTLPTRRLMCRIAPLAAGVPGPWPALAIFGQFSNIRPARVAWMLHGIPGNGWQC